MFIKRFSDVDQIVLKTSNLNVHFFNV